MWETPVDRTLDKGRAVPRAPLELATNFQNELL